MAGRGVNERVVIIGAGHAGTSAAIQLRSLGFAGTIDLVGEEPHIPYHRPPLSKAWLLGKAGDETIALKPASFYAEQAISLQVGCRVDGIDRVAQRVSLNNGQQIPYDWLIVATGSRARRLPWALAGGSHLYELRTRSDAEALRQALQPGKRVLIVGAGYIGLEGAASARARGASVVVIERENRVLARVASEAVSAFFQRYHADRGVRFRFNESITQLLVRGSPPTCEVSFDRGIQEQADLVLVGVGAVPNQELGAACGLYCDDGIIVDQQTRTSDARIFAIGDCSRRPLQLYERTGRLESVANALEQARLAAHTICDAPAPVHEVPWFWSDQYDLKLQIAGLSFDVGLHVTRGDPSSARFAVFHLNGAGQLQAVEAVNAAPEFLAGRKLIASRRVLDPHALADASTSIKEIAAQVMNGEFECRR